ncbi:MAG TPA: GDP-mannose 4,6-dehydratase [Thermomicrobiales bacterium]|nr:GDP-mannose 4,6-dehydratase [Thermomicrobiales bacterium]
MAGGARKALVTGALGFAGRHLLAELERQTDWDLIGLARGHGSAAGRERLLACDLRDADLVGRVIAHHRPDIVFHLAAQSYVPQAIAAPAETINNNVSGQVNLLEACRAASLDATILIVGSSEVYGRINLDDVPIREDQPFRPVNPYAVSKIAQDMLGLQYVLSYGMRIIRVRPFNHFGPGQSDRFVLSTFARQVAEAELQRIEPVVLTGNLDARRDFLDVRDVVRAYRMLIEFGEPGEVYNVASGSAHRIGDLLDRLIAMATLPIEVRPDPARMRPSDVPVVIGDASRLRDATGWEPLYTADQSLRDTLDDWRDHLSRGEETTLR